MGKLTYLVIHCADTPAKMEVTPGMLEEWHKGPRDLDNGKVKYLGKVYNSRRVLPKHLINGIPIRQLIGRGWDRLGYSDILHRDGKTENLTPYNNDDIITSDEMTWGVAGINSVARHLVLVGGKGPLGTFDDYFTQDQDEGLFCYCKRTILHHPNITIVGHNQFDIKPCPGFFVYDWLMDHGIERFGNRKHKL